jgi:hypothetical protein
VLTPVPYGWNPVCPWYDWAVENCKKQPNYNDMRVAYDDCFLREGAYRDEVNSFVEYVQKCLRESVSEQEQAEAWGEARGEARVEAKGEAMDS